MVIYSGCNQSTDHFTVSPSFIQEVSKKIYELHFKSSLHWKRHKVELRGQRLTQMASCDITTSWDILGFSQNSMGKKSQTLVAILKHQMMM